MNSRVFQRMSCRTYTEERKACITFQQIDILPALTYDKNSETRKRLYVGYENRRYANLPLFRDAVLRDKAARLSGYPSHAGLSLRIRWCRSRRRWRNSLQSCILN
ncbi:uncharacterized protein BDW43DRAFT_172811 [Aspergillus alliaceus]|uniref:uncharacterized protein n=1 Tax=Petromyces alliaceus TaxID=209559 RepID=UPI0012A4DEBB|nr:uncharacterized protein BDW43DRAFT_172811 [Aspergillus alliaceus]KAB8230111.1 hypothetical protein BDW43DRAFT_172811 [Aspergillus alliaceus]